MLSLIFNKSSHNIAYRLMQLQEAQIEDISTTSYPRIFDVTRRIPAWILDRNNDPSRESYFVDFLQHYYDWLYGTYNFGGYVTSSNKLSYIKLIDFEKSPVSYIEHFAFSYAPGFPREIFNFEENITNIENVRKFILGIRQNFYQKKGTKEAFRYFFGTVQNKELDEFNIEYPKRQILRLNGGRFSGWPSDIEPEFTDSVLNRGIFQDNYWYQDYSYVVSLNSNDDGYIEYEESIKTLAHPVGLKGFYELRLDSYTPSDGYEDDFNLCEQSILGNYFPYRLTDISGYSACIGCSGSPYMYDGAGYGDGNSFSGATFDMPTYNFPSWSTGLTGILGPDGLLLKFGDINISNFVFLCNAAHSPNLGITGCTANTDCGGGACWDCE